MPANRFTRSPRASARVSAHRNVLITHADSNAIRDYRSSGIPVSCFRDAGLLRKVGNHPNLRSSRFSPRAEVGFNVRRVRTVSRYHMANARSWIDGSNHVQRLGGGAKRGVRCRLGKRVAPIVAARRFAGSRRRENAGQHRASAPSREVERADVTSHRCSIAPPSAVPARVPARAHGVSAAPRYYVHLQTIKPRRLRAQSAEPGTAPR